jgi:hypothetical protein
MQIRLYVDEDAMARTLVRGLRARGVDVTTVLDAGMSAQDDMAQRRAIRCGMWSTFRAKIPLDSFISPWNISETKPV